ncbi:hypothetical protein Rhe02_18980 [Rhizocola hellebori]|uniref:Uncharacterized protein n=1 Tax=Rhizocola hellebori TaxID=1392758 RepID=A0A8J3Q5S3_9ACTN|nr:hypothetical protein [Rhizocola hellebori]GIH03831.1 hypothetical protein Rhe02_18980 [Rhizocola hellebori]
MRSPSDGTKHAAGLPAYAAPGIIPLDGYGDLRNVVYSGGQLAACATVAVVLDAIPPVLTSVEEAWPGHTLALTRAQLCVELSLGTGDGLNWTLSFGDAVGYLVQPYQSHQESDPDLLVEELAAQPDVDSVNHHDTESFEVRMARVYRADEMLARWLDAIVKAHRSFARHRGIALPY